MESVSTSKLSCRCHIHNTHGGTDACNSICSWQPDTAVQAEQICADAVKNKLATLFGQYVHAQEHMDNSSMWPCC